MGKQSEKGESLRNRGKLGQQESREEAAPGVQGDRILMLEPIAICEGFDFLKCQS